MTKSTKFCLNFCVFKLQVVVDATRSKVGLMKDSNLMEKMLETNIREKFNLMKDFGDSESCKTREGTGCCRWFFFWCENK